MDSTESAYYLGLFFPFVVSQVAGRGNAETRETAKTPATETDGTAAGTYEDACPAVIL